MKRSLAAGMVFAMLATFGVACSSDGGDFSVTTKTGVTVSGQDGDVTAEKAANPPEMPAAFQKVGSVTKVEGKLKGFATITLPVPNGVELSDVSIMRHDGHSWGAMPPQETDPKARTVSVTTSEFSLWGTATWDAEQARDEFAANVRNQLSSDGFWIVGAAGKLATNPPITHCNDRALTLKLDKSRFVPRAILCPKFVKTDTSRGTYRLHVSNMQAYPVLLRLPAGVRRVGVRPTPNPVSQLLVRTNPRAALLPGASELTLEVKASQLQKGAKITGTLDLSAVTLDVGMAALRVVTGYDWNDKVVARLGKIQEFTDYLGCVASGSENIAKEYAKKKFTIAQTAGAISKTAAGCMTTELVAALVRDYVKANFRGPDKYAEALAKQAATQFKRAITLIESAYIVPQLVATHLASKAGQTSFALGLELDEPPGDLYKALPSTGMGGLEEISSPVNGGQLLFVGSNCHLQPQMSPTSGASRWQTWQLNPGSAAAGYTRSGVAGVTIYVQIAYVRPEYKGTVQSLFHTIGGDREECREEEGPNRVVTSPYNGPALGGLTEYHSGFTGYKGLPSAVARGNLYDPHKGIVVQVSAHSETPSELTEKVEPEQITRAAEAMKATVTYMAHLADARLGTRFTS